MKKGFSIQDYLEKNKITMGTVKKEVGTSIYKGGHNDLRKTSYDVKIKDGKFQLDTHKTIMTEGKKPINEGNGIPIIWISPTKTFDYFGTKLTIKKGEEGLSIARDYKDVYLVEFQKVRFYATWHVQFEQK
jgi:hypothetical protein